MLAYGVSPLSFLVKGGGGLSPEVTNGGGFVGMKGFAVGDSFLRPGSGLSAAVAPWCTCAGLTLFQCCTSNRGSPPAVVPTRTLIQVSPSLSTISNGPSKDLPKSPGLPFFT